MANNETHKSNRIISFDKLTDDLKEQFAEAYPQPDGYEPYLKKFIKPDGTPMFYVPFETDDTAYMVKFEVKIDSPMAEDELEKDLFGDSTKGGDMSEMDILEQNDNGEKDESHREFTLNHGDYEKSYAEEAAIADATQDNAFDDDEDVEDDEVDKDEDELGDEDDEDLEPDEAELLDIELELMEEEKEVAKERKKESKSKKETAKAVKKETKTTEKKSKTAEKQSAKASKAEAKVKEKEEKPDAKKKAPKGEKETTKATTKAKKETKKSK